MREFLLGVLGSYEQKGLPEFATGKLEDYLTAKYGTTAVAKAKLGEIKHIRAAYFAIQGELYRD